MDAADGDGHASRNRLAAEPEKPAAVAQPRAGAVGQGAPALVTQPAGTDDVAGDAEPARAAAGPRSTSAATPRASISFVLIELEAM